MINEKRFIIIVSLSLIILFIFKAILKGENAIVVKLKDVSYVKTDKVYLKDISFIIGDKSIGNIKIINSPSAGQFILVNKNLIANIIKNKTNKNVKIYGNENIKIIRQAFIYSKEILEKLVNNFLKQHAKEIFKDAKWTIIRVITPPRVLLPYDNTDVKITCDNDHITNRIILNISFLKNNNVIKRVNATVFFKIYKKVVVAKNDIKPRQILTSDYLELKEVPIKNFNLRYITDINSIIGKQSTRFIKKGNIITSNMVKIPPTVKRGSLVKVIATDGNIVISTIGKALDSGIINTPIRVMNLNSGKIFIGKIIAPNEVIVTF